jgi:hypothetical protein
VCERHRTPARVSEQVCLSRGGAPGKTIMRYRVRFATPRALQRRHSAALNAAEGDAGRASSVYSAANAEASFVFAARTQEPRKRQSCVIASSCARTRMWLGFTRSRLLVLATTALVAHGAQSSLVLRPRLDKVVQVRRGLRVQLAQCDFAIAA